MTSNHSIPQASANDNQANNQTNNQTNNNGLTDNSAAAASAQPEVSAASTVRSQTTQSAQTTQSSQAALSATSSFPKSPYKGLNPYAATDAELFFGRARETQRIVNNLLAWRLTVLYGESGVGKSSVLRAGVTHALQEEAQDNLDDFGVPKLAVVVFPPLHGERFWQQDPLQSLAQQIDEDIRQNYWPVEPPEPGLSFVEMLRVWTERLGGEQRDGRLFIILDQFEEYFLYHPQNSQESDLVTAIAHVVNLPDLQVNFLISLREDSYAKLDRLRGRLPNILDVCLHIEHLDKQSAYDAITKPIERYNEHQPPAQKIDISADLVDAILQGIPQIEEYNSNGRAGVEKLKNLRKNQILAPYLQLVMMRLWDEMVQVRSHDLSLETLINLAESETPDQVTKIRAAIRRLKTSIHWADQNARDQNTHDQNTQIKRAVRRIVREHVTTTMDALSQPEKDIAARSFQYLVTPSGTKYAYSATDLANLMGRNPESVIALLMKLAQNKRIIRPVGPSQEQPNVQRYEIFHDFLAQAILGWRRNYLEEKKRKSRIQKSIVLVAGSFACGLFLLSLSAYHYQQRINWLIAVSNESIQKFHSGQQLLALQDAIIAGQGIKERSENNFLKYILLSPSKRTDAVNLAKENLQSILTQIQLQRYYSAPTDQTLQTVLSPDWQVVAVVLADGSLQIWDQQTGELLHTLRQTSEKTLALRFSSDSKMLAAVFLDGTIRRWDWQNGTELAHIKTLESPNRVLMADFSGDGQTLAVASTHSVSAEDVTVQLWDWQAGTPYAAIQPSGSLSSLKVGSDGQTLVTTSTVSNKTDPLAAATSIIQLWNGKTGIEQAQFETESRPSNLVLNNDGNVFAFSTDDGTVELWDLQDREYLKAFKPYDLILNQIQSLSFNPDGSLLAIGFQNGQVKLWDWQDDKLQNQIQMSEPVNDLVFDPTGQQIATLLSRKHLSFWRLQSPVTAMSINSFKALDRLGELRLSPNSEQVAALSWLDGTIQLWNIADQKLSAEFNPNGRVQDFHFSPDGQTLVTASDDHLVQRWNLQGSLIDQFKMPNSIRSVSFSPDGQQLLTTLNDTKLVQVWDLQGIKRAQVNPSGNVLAADFSPDGQLLITLSDNGSVILQLWDLQGNELAQFNPSGTTLAVNFSPKDQILTTASDSGFVQFWNLQGQEQTRFKVADAIRTISYSPDGQTLATATFNNDTVQLWNLKGDEQGQFKAPGIVLDLQFSIDGKSLIATSQNGFVEQWQLNSTSLDSLIHQGCDWLQPYLASHPDKAQDLPCQFNTSNLSK
ncbi:MAG: nSTAND1 domain-containing NTPase [Thainema sp.]